MSIQHTFQTFLDLLQFDPMCTTENPIENNNRPFPSTQEQPTEINMILDQQETENTQSLLSTQTNQQYSDTNTNRQNQDTNTFNVDTRTINTVNSPTPQQEVDTDTEEQTDQQLQTDNIQPLSTHISSTRSNIIHPPQNQNFDADITRSHPSTSLYPTIPRPETSINPYTNPQRSHILTNPYNKINSRNNIHKCKYSTKIIPKNKSYIISITSIVKHIC